MVITFTKEECKIHNIKIGSVLDLGDIVVINNERKTKLKDEKQEVKKNG